MCNNIFYTIIFKKNKAIGVIKTNLSHIFLITSLLPEGYDYQNIHLNNIIRVIYKQDEIIIHYKDGDRAILKPNKIIARLGYILYNTLPSYMIELKGE